VPAEKPPSIPKFADPYRTIREPSPGPASVLLAALKPVATTKAPARSPQSAFELALTLAAMGEPAEAIATLRALVGRAPGFPGAWRKLADLLEQTGDPAGAAQARAAAGPATPSAETPPARPAPRGKQEAAEGALKTLIGDKPADIAELLLRDRARQAPDDPALLHVLAETMMRQRRHADAATLLERTLDLAPGSPSVRHSLALALFRDGREAASIPHIEQLLARDPTRASYRILLAACCAMTGQLERAISIYEDVLKQSQGTLDLWLSYAQALKNVGRRADSVRALRTCTQIAPHSGQTWWNLVNQMEGAPAATDIDAMRGALDGALLSSEERFPLHYAIAHALEKAGDFAASFAHYEAGARHYRQRNVYRADELSRQVARAKAEFSASLFAERTNFGCADPAPIFVLGMPRAGSTLVEQILASHSQVEGTRELNEISHIARDLEGAFRTPDSLAKVRCREFAALGARYIERTRPHRKRETRFFIDKMPSNWLHAGLIHLILPKAKIIDARRHPMANGFAAFKMYFPQGQDFSYDLGDIGRYYNDYRALMDHFDTVLPNRIHRVIYEDMVADTEAEIRRLLAYCGLNFEPACLRFWETRRAVTTASAGQVRQPIFRESLDHWRNYEPWLGPLKDALTS
jgi:tetratricopeptide (TPR) repeat protein